MMIVQAAGYRIEEIVAGLGQSLHDGQILVLLRMAGPALGHVLDDVGIAFEPSAVADGFGGGQFSVGQARQTGHHLENGAGLGAGLNGVIHEQAPLILHDLQGGIAALHHGVQIIIGVLGQGQNVALVALPQVHHDQHAGGGQPNGKFRPIAGGNFILVGFQPVGFPHALFLPVPDIIHVVPDITFRRRLVLGVDGQLHGVAVLGGHVG